MTILNPALAKRETQHSSNATDLRLPADKFQQPRFTLFHYPDVWVWDDDTSDFLPDLGRIYHVPGSNNVKEVGGKPDATLAIAQKQQKGAVIIYPGMESMGPHKDYLVSWETNLGAKSGRHFAMASDRYEHHGRRGAYKVNTKAEYLKFVLYYRDESNMCKAMPYATYRALRGQEVSRLRQRERTNKSEAVLNRFRKRIEAMDAAWTRMSGEDLEQDTAPVQLSPSQTVTASPEEIAAAQGADMSPPTPSNPKLARKRTPKKSTTSDDK